MKLVVTFTCIMEQTIDIDDKEWSDTEIDDREQIINDHLDETVASTSSFQINEVEDVKGKDIEF